MDIGQAKNIPANAVYLGVGWPAFPAPGLSGWVHRLLTLPRGWVYGPLRAWWRVDGKLVACNLEYADWQTFVGEVSIKWLRRETPG